MVTLFTFGYRGWGNCTRQLVDAIDASERKRGFSPPIFFDIRYKRNVRAEGFRGDAFERLLPKGRYRWFPRLGNANIGTGKPWITKIADPFSSRILLAEAQKYAKRNRRIIFFCACDFPRFCHRHIVANLLLKDAERTGHRIKITEWPGGAPIRTQVHVQKEIFEAVCGDIVNIHLSNRLLPHDLVDLPWGSIVDVISGEESIPIISGPAKCQKGWILRIWEQSEPNTPAAELRRISESWLKSKGIRTIQSSAPSKQRLPLRALSVQQPWAHAIMRLGKDVENRSWRSKYSGPLLIHASARREPNPQGQLHEFMAKAPPKSRLLHLPTSAIIGVVDLVDYTKARISGVRIPEDSKSKWAQTGYWHWQLRNARPIRPVECNGRLGLWTPTPSVLRRLPAWVRNLRVNHPL
jgi:hypothetical protein